jgi:hypothetical protein
MIRRATRSLGNDPIEAQLTQIKFIDKGIDNLGRVVLIDPVVEKVRKQRALPTIRALNEAPLS